MIPKDPMMLLSYLNTQLRDQYPNLEELCKAKDIDQDEIIQKLQSIDYSYNQDLNKFV